MRLIRNLHWLFFLLLPITASGAPLMSAEAQLRDILRKVRLDGVVEAVHQGTVSAQTSGAVESVGFDVDDLVEKDAVIVQLKDTEQRARLTQAQAALKSAQARLDEARTDFKRNQEVYERKAISEAALDRSRAALQAAEAGFEQAQAALTQAREQLDYTRIRAPYSGIVTERHVERGEMVNPGQPVMSGISLDRLRVTVDVPQRLIPYIREHKQAWVALPDDKLVKAEKLVIFPHALPGSNSFRVRLELPDGIEGLVPGMFVKAAFHIHTDQELLIPQQAVAYRSEVSAVYVLDGQQRLHMRHVRLGQRTGDGMIEIRAGIEPGERIVLDPVAAASALKAQQRSAHDK